MNTLTPGSATYYAFRFSQEKEALTTVWRFFHEIEKTVEKATEPKITELKLQWWYQEIDRLFAGNAQHPITRAIYPLIKKKDLSQHYFQSYLQAMINDLNDPYFHTKDEMFTFFRQLKGSEYGLYSQLLASSKRRLETFVMQMGILHECIHRIARIGLDLKRGRIYFPHQDLQQFNINPALLLQKNTTIGHQHLLKQQATYARTAYQTALDYIKPQELKTVASLLILANIQLALLEEIVRENFNVLLHSYQLTPLRMLWIALRTQFSVKKSKDAKPRTQTTQQSY